MAAATEDYSVNRNGANGTSVVFNSGFPPLL
jgi:hypothetical protein